MRIESGRIAVLLAAGSGAWNNLLCTTVPRDVICRISEYAQEVAGGNVEVQTERIVASERRDHDGNDAVDSLRM